MMIFMIMTMIFFEDLGFVARLTLHALIKKRNIYHFYFQRFPKKWLCIF